MLLSVVLGSIVLKVTFGPVLQELRIGLRFRSVGPLLIALVLKLRKMRFSTVVSVRQVCYGSFPSIATQFEPCAAYSFKTEKLNWFCIGERGAAPVANAYGKLQATGRKSPPSSTSSDLFHYLMSLDFHLEGVQHGL